MNLSLWILWLIFAAVLFIIEIMTPAFMFGLFGAGAVVTAIVSFFFPKLWHVQILVFAVSSFIFVIFGRRIFLKYIVKKEKETKTNAESYIGKIFKLTETVNNIEEKGAVKINGVRWRARSEDDSVIEEGMLVIVTSLDGVKLIVKKAENAQ